MIQTDRELRPDPLEFSADFDEAAARLRLSGPVTMGQVEILERESGRALAAAPAVLQLDLLAARDFDIGPAWLLSFIYRRLS